jgi:hypothetical protein
LLGDFSDDYTTRRVNQALELFQMLGNRVSRVGSFTRRSDEDCSLDRSGQLNDVSGDLAAPWL